MPLLSTPPTPTLAEFMRKLRARLALTQNGMAHVLGVSGSTVSKIEQQGQATVSMVTRRVIDKLMKREGMEDMEEEWFRLKIVWLREDRIRKGVWY